MRIAAGDLIDDLVDRTKRNMKVGEELKSLTTEELNCKASPTTWSALECLEHLNRYGQFYLPEVRQRIEGKKASQKCFYSGWLGNYFANMMLPNDAPKAMKTVKSMNPNGSVLDRSVMEVFLEQQEEWLKVLESCRRQNLTKVRTSISLTSLIKLRLGDTLRFVIYHNERHIAQALRALNCE